MKRDVSPFAIVGHPSGLVIQAEVAVFCLIHGRFDAFMWAVIFLPIVPLLDYRLQLRATGKMDSKCELVLLQAGVDSLLQGLLGNRNPLLLPF